MRQSHCFTHYFLLLFFFFSFSLVSLRVPLYTVYLFIVSLSLPRPTIATRVLGWAPTHTAGCPRSGSWSCCAVSWPLSSSTSRRTLECSERKKRSPAQFKINIRVSFIFLSFSYLCIHWFFNFPECTSNLTPQIWSSISPVWCIQEEKTTEISLCRSVRGGSTWNSSRKSLASSASFLL